MPAELPRILLALGSRRRLLAAAAGLGLFALLFFGNAWVGDDAYITFRSVEQLFAGNGPRWNPHERVQAFTHPLWFGVLAVFRIASRDVFLNAVIASFLCSALALVVLGRFFAFSGRWLLCVLMLCVSRSFVDYSSSGLENPLSFLLAALFVASVLDGRLREPKAASEATRSVAWFAFLLALALCNRHDLAPLLVPPTAYVAWRSRSIGRWRVAGALLVGLAPFLLWTLFSLAYYGFPFPNTACAKLKTGIPVTDLVRQGVAYLWSDLRWDPITPGAILLAIVLGASRREGVFRAIGLGLLLHVLYVLRVGGDFMHGRMWTVAFFLAVPVILEMLKGAPKALLALGVACLIAVAIEPNAPLRMAEGRIRPYMDSHGIGDERAYYFGTSSLRQWLRWDPRRDGPVFPRHEWAFEGARLAQDREAAGVVARAIGYLGYWAGTDRRIIDALGLADPLLARLPCEHPWRIGHFERRLPDGYIESVANNCNVLADPRLARFYDRLRLITQGPLGSAERLRTLVAMNLGLYDPLLESYVRSHY